VTDTSDVLKGFVLRWQKLLLFAMQDATTLWDAEKNRRKNYHVFLWRKASGERMTLGDAIFSHSVLIHAIYGIIWNVFDFTENLWRAELISL